MLIDTSSTPYPKLEQTKKRRWRVPIYFSSYKALRRSKMTKGKRALSKTNESAFGDVQRGLRFGRGETRESEDVLELTVESLHVGTQDTFRVQNPPRPTHMPIVSVSLHHFLPFYYFIACALPNLAV